MSKVPSSRVEVKDSERLARIRPFYLREASTEVENFYQNNPEVVQWIDDSWKFGLTPLCPAKIPFKMDVEPKDLKLMSGLRTMTPIVCWFCLQGGGGDDDKTPLYKMDTGCHEDHPCTIWTYCKDCKEHALRSVAVHLATQKKVPMTPLINPESFKVLRKSGQLETGFKCFYMHLMKNECKGTDDFIIYVVNAPANLSKGLLISDAIKHNPGMIFKPDYPKHFPKEIKTLFDEKLRMAYAQVDIERAASAEMNEQAKEVVPVEPPMHNISQ